MSANSEKTGLKFTFGGQPLFTRDFAVNCQSACDGMVVWTGYKPPIENYQNDENVRTYESDMRKASPTVDVTNAFAEGGFVGMELLVQALTKVGPYLTRVRLRAVLDSMDLRTGLTVQPTLSWRPGSHFAAASMQGFAIQYKGNFSGWRTGDIVRDSTPQSGCGGPCYP
jgi:ABC-type branched-subunit amino acid transport system substrate-binding protein